MDWVHCNRCYIQPGEEGKKFFITNCGHIYCDECLQINLSNECRICHIKFTTIPLTSNMNSEIEIYFHDPLVNLKKQIKILEFQQSHRIRLVTHNREGTRNYKALRKENHNLSEELKLCKKENASLREQIKLMKTDFLEFKKKYEFLGSRDQERTSQGTPQLHSFSQFNTKSAQRITPTLSQNNYESSEGLLDRNFRAALKRPANPNFFLMSESNPSTKDDIPKFPGPYRNTKMRTPDMETPPTPEAIIRQCNQKDPLQRKVKLPGSISGPSPATKIGFHGLTLSRPTSTPNKESTFSKKYMKYFK